MHAAFGVSMMVAAAIAASPVAVESPREPTRETPVMAPVATSEATESLEATESAEATVVPDPEFDSFAEYLDWMVGQH